MPNPCYKIVTDHVGLFQGDILPDCPYSVLLAIPPDDIGTREYPEVPVQIDLHDAAIIMSQSCDLRPRKEGKKKGEDRIDNVVFCPVHTLKEFEEKLRDGDVRTQLSRGRRIGFYLLPQTPSKALFKGDLLVADFHNTFSLPIKIVRQLILPKGRRLRIKSPYRESLSQAFARFFMRVALPDDDDNPGF